jgi:hypothetical protein
MSIFRELVQKEILKKLNGSPEEIVLDQIKVAILHAVSECKCNIEFTFETPLDSDSLCKLRALCYLELGFDLPQITSFNVFIDFKHFL